MPGSIMAPKAAKIDKETPEGSDNLPVSPVIGQE